MSEGGGFGRDSGTPRRRQLPAVTDVVRELARTVSTDPAVLFKAARSVVGDELARVKQGFESAPLDVLVKRARRQLEQEGFTAPAGDAEEPREPKSISIPAPPLGPKEKTAVPSAGDGPFQSAGAADLDWEKDLNIHPVDAPFRSAILPLPPKSRAPQEFLPLEKIAAPAAAPPPSSRLPLPERVTAPDGLAVERSGTARAPKPPIEELPLFSKSEPPLEPPMLAPPPPPPPPPVHEPPAPRLEPPAPWREPPAPLLESPAKSMSEMPPLAGVVGEQTEPVEPEMQAFAFKAAEKPAPPKKSGKTGWIVAVAVVLAVAAGLVWAVRTFLSGDVVKTVEVPLPEPVPAPKTRVEAASAPAPAPVPKATPVPKAASAPVRAAAVPKGKAALLLTPDWSGKSAVYVVHFSSHKDRPSAEKEAKRLARALGKPGRAVEVDLGKKGVWYRVVIGDFAGVEEARAYRADLEAKKTPDLGFVYEMRGR